MFQYTCTPAPPEAAASLGPVQPDPTGAQRSHQPGPRQASRYREVSHHLISAGSTVSILFCFSNCLYDQAYCLDSLAPANADAGELMRSKSVVILFPVIWSLVVWSQSCGHWYCGLRSCGA